MAIEQHEIRNRQAAPSWMPPKLSECLRKGCFVCIEHAPAVRPGYTRWELWGRPSCYDGDAMMLDREIENCKAAHADHCIRLNVEDLGFHSRMSLCVHRPHSAAASPSAGTSR